MKGLFRPIKSRKEEEEGTTWGLPTRLEWLKKLFYCHYMKLTY